MAGTMFDGFFVQATLAGSSVTHTTLRDLEFYDMTVFATAANGGATVKLVTASGDVTDAVACASDGAIARAGTIDDATKLAAAGTTVTFTVAGGADGIATGYCLITGSGIALS
jgi:hypothetical protein